MGCCYWASSHNVGQLLIAIPHSITLVILPVEISGFKASIAGHQSSSGQLDCTAFVQRYIGPMSRIRGAARGNVTGMNQRPILRVRAGRKYSSMTAMSSVSQLRVGTLLVTPHMYLLTIRRSSLISSISGWWRRRPLRWFV